MSLTSEELFQQLKRLEIECTTHSHPAVFTVDQASQHCNHLPGFHCKNLFFKDKKGHLWLIVTCNKQEINIKALQKAIGSARLSFGKPDLLKQTLGVTPGSVSPFALINDTACLVRVVLDAKMMEADIINFHPLRNNATTAITPEGLRKFIKACGHFVQELEFSALERV